MALHWVYGRPAWRLEQRVRSVGELFSVFAPCVRRQLRYYSLWDLAPALHSFKRRDFPCRTTSASGSYLDHVSNVLDRMSICEAVSHASSPLLQVHGKWDLITSFKQATEINQSYGGPKELVTLPHDSHFTSLFSPVFRECMRAWLQARFAS